MKRLALLLIPVLLGLDVAAQTPPGPALPATNLLSNPFAIPQKVELPPPPVALKPASLPLPPLAVAPPAPSLPAGLRVILVGQSGTGLLGTADTAAASIVVNHGQSVRMGDQDYHAEVGASGIRLYTAPRGKLVWEGTLGGPGLITPPIDMSQLKFVPPLSAGVNPGLGSARSTMPSSEPLITRTGSQ